MLLPGLVNAHGHAAMVLLRGEEKIPLQVYLKRIIVDLTANEEFATALMRSEYSFETVTAAIMVASIIPVLIIYPYAQRYFRKGIMLGGVKE